MFKQKAAPRPRDRRVAVPWCGQREWAEATEGARGPLADARPGHLARDGQVFGCGLVSSLNWDQGVVSYCVSAESQALGTVVSEMVRFLPCGEVEGPSEVPAAMVTVKGAMAGSDRSVM